MRALSTAQVWTMADTRSLPKSKQQRDFEMLSRGPASMTAFASFLYNNLPNFFVLFFPCFLKRYSGSLEEYYLYDLAAFLHQTDSLPSWKTKITAPSRKESEWVLRMAHRACQTGLHDDSFTGNHA